MEKNYLLDKNFRLPLLLFAAGIIIVNLITIMVMYNQRATSYAYVAVTFGSLLLSLIAIFVSIWQYGSQKSSEGVLANQLKDLAGTAEALSSSAKMIGALPEHLDRMSSRLEQTATIPEIERVLQTHATAPASEGESSSPATTVPLERILGSSTVSNPIVEITLNVMLKLQRMAGAAEYANFVQLLGLREPIDVAIPVAVLSSGANAFTLVLRNAGHIHQMEDGKLILSEELKEYIVSRRPMLNALDGMFTGAAQAIDQLK